MKWLVICYAVHERLIASKDQFDTEEDAKEFIRTDSKNTYEEELENASDADKEKISLEINEDNTAAKLSSHYDEYIWTWEIVKVET